MDIPGLNIQIPAVNPQVSPQNISKSFQDVLSEGSSSSTIGNISSTQKMTEVTPTPKLRVDKTENTNFNKIFSGLISGQGKLDKIIKLATSGKSFSPTELLAIQAGVYKFSQELELTSKVVEKATDGVKQTLQTQV